MALACELPAASGTPLAKWSCRARETAARGITASISARTVRRWLAQDVRKPWRHRSWIFPRDPYFAVKAGRVFDLYERIWAARPLGGDEYVLSADEKPGVQARRRIHPALPPGAGRPMRVENECARCGTLAHLAAYDVHRGQVMGRCEPATGIKPFTALVDQVMNAKPYASARRVFRVVDDGASHRDWAAARPDERRLAERGHGAPAGARLPAQPDRGTTFRSSSASCWSLMTSLICPSSQRRSAASSAGTAAQPSSPGSAAP